MQRFIEIDGEEHIEISPQWDKNTVVVRRVTDEDKKKFPVEYADFKKSQEPPPVKAPDADYPLTAEEVVDKPDSIPFWKTRYEFQS
jgi:hypothetical protein